MTAVKNITTCTLMTVSQSPLVVELVFVLEPPVENTRKLDRVVCFAIINSYFSEISFNWIGIDCDEDEYPL